MSTTLTHWIELVPNVAQARLFARAAGTARFAYNWGLARWKERYEARKADASRPPPSGNGLRKLWNAVRRQEFPWSYEVPADASNDALTHLQAAFDAFFKKKAKYPKFKKKGERDAFSMDARQLAWNGRHVTMPRMGTVRMVEGLRFTGKVLRTVTISREADRWYLSAPVEMAEYSRSRTGDEIVGVDLGLTTLATLSTGETIGNPRPLRKALEKLARVQRDHARKVKGSANRRKSAQRIARIHRRVANTRKHVLHTLTSRLCRENQAVGIEGLRPANMVKNRSLSLSISDAAFGEFRRQMTYKAPLYGTRLLVADPFEPSTKRCSACGIVGPSIPLSERTFRCVPCGHVAGRDVNAAINLRTLVVRGTAARESGDACGEGVRPSRVPATAVLVEAGSRARSPHANA